VYFEKKYSEQLRKKSVIVVSVLHQSEVKHCVMNIQLTCTGIKVSIYSLPVLIDSRTASFVTWVMVGRTGIALATKTQWTTTQLCLVMSQHILRICEST